MKQIKITTTDNLDFIITEDEVWEAVRRLFIFQGEIPLNKDITLHFGCGGDMGVWGYSIDVIFSDDTTEQVDLDILMEQGYWKGSFYSLLRDGDEILDGFVENIMNIISEKYA